MAQGTRDTYLVKSMATLCIPGWVGKILYGMLPQEIKTKIEQLSQRNTVYGCVHQVKNVSENSVIGAPGWCCHVSV